MVRRLPILAVLLLTACGQGGALYLPDHPPAKSNPAKKTTPPPATPEQTPAQPASPPASNN